MQSTKFENGITACLDCMQSCERCTAACLSEENVTHMRDCIRLNLLCADICLLSARYMSRQSGFEAEVCDLCKRICEACAEECDKHEMDHCKQCARTCQACAQVCSEMSDQV